MINSNSTEIFEQWSKFSNEASKLNSIISQAIEHSARQNIGTTNALLNDSVNNIQKLITSKKIDEVAAVQTKIASEVTAKIIDYSQQNLENWLNFSTQLSKWAESSISNIAKQPSSDKSKGGNKVA